MSKIMKQDIESIILTELGWENFINSTIFITGATGFIGSYLISSILERNKIYAESTKIIAAVRNVSKAEIVFGDYKGDKNLLFYIGDITSSISYTQNIDYIIHCASNAAPDKYQSDPVGTMTINLEGTKNVMSFAFEKKVKKVIYISTLEVYGRTSVKNTISENDFGFISSTNVRSCYSESKKCSELLTYCYGSQYGIPVCIARLSYVYGAGMDINDAKVCAYFARSVVNNNDIVLKSAGTQKRSYTYISDVITGIFTILAKGQNGEAYNVSSSKSVITITDFARLHSEVFPEKKIKVLFDIPTATEEKGFSFIQDAVLNSNKLEMLGWNPVVSLSEGIRRSVLFFSGK